MTRRLFVAAWLPETAREEASEVLERLRESDTSVKWVSPENLHVTLRFLGDVEESFLDSMIQRLTKEFASVESFDVRFDGIEMFPKRGAPRVVWIGLERGAREIASLASRTERALLDAGVLSEIEKRPFQAHVTLGRPRGARGLGRLESLLEQVEVRGGMHLLEEVRLVESRLSPRGAEYRAVGRFPLTGRPAASSSPTTEDVP